MSDKMFELYKKVIANEGRIDNNGIICSDIDDCYEEGCIFGEVYPSCHKNSKRCLEIAKKYIEDIDFIEEVIKECKSIKEENKMEKTLLEIITEGFNNKVYEDKEGNTVYVASNNELIFNYKKPKNLVSNVIITKYKLDEKYKLERKKYNIQEAIESYREGMEIESCITGETYKKVNDIGVLISGNYKCSFEPTISIKEVLGMWYINK